MARVTFVKVENERDYADVRYEVLLDGVKVGEVYRRRESRVEPYAGKMYGRQITATIWDWQATGHRSFRTSRSRVDAAMDLLESVRGMSYAEAREAAGKRGLL